MGRRSSWLVALVVGWCTACLAAVLVVVPSGGRDLAFFVDTFVVTNTVTGVALAVAGSPIALLRPRNAIGWLLLTGAAGFLTTSGGMAVLAQAQQAGAVGTGWRAVGTAAGVAFAWPLTFALPVTLLLFPDGRLPSARWRPALVAPVLALVGAAGAALAVPNGLSSQAGYPDLVPDSARFAWLAGAFTVPMLGAYLLGAAALIERYRRGDDTVRRQVLWVLFAVAVFVLSALLSFGDENLLGVVPLALIPVSVTVAILRHNLLDIRLVVSRSALYLSLSLAALAAYSGLVVMLDLVFRERFPGAPVLATLAIAVAFNPARVFLQRTTDRLFYGTRDDPARTLAEVGDGMGSGLDGVLEALCRTLHLPGAAVRVEDRVVAAHGTLPDVRHTAELRQGEEIVGELTVGLRRGESRIDAADRRLIELLAAPIAVSVRAGLLADRADTLAEELRVSREQLVSGREEERRRLRRDLHDGLGPLLTGVVFNVDAARHLAGADPEQAVALLRTAQDQTTRAVDEIRRLVDDLRPPSLDLLGLDGALRHYAAAVLHHRDGGPLAVTVTTAGLQQELPAAAEVAVYRIVSEALTNVAKHSTAATATVDVAASHSEMVVTVADDGRNDGHWTPGVGITSIGERAAELQGVSDIRIDPRGCRVRVVIPLASGAPA